ncbi:MAG TPA: hypothetical protein ENK18_11835 [Deltaproteobacteria bacterium]|nr:hypothetical protein [Deltaproteobacteria bacterium]
MDPLETGPCTLIIARNGPLDLASDRALLRAVEGEAGLSPGSLRRPSTMDAQEFRLIEGVARPVAERLAGAAARGGYSPRIRDRLGIKWSSERGSEMSLWFTLLSVGFALASMFGFPALAALLGSATVLPVLLVVVPLMMVAMVGLYRWQLSRIYMPLIVPLSALPLEDAALLREPVREALHEALRGLLALEDALGQGIVPAAAIQDLEQTTTSMNDQVLALQAEAHRISRRSATAVAALQHRIDAVRGHSGEEFEALLAEIEAAEAAEELRTARLEEIVAELIEICRVTQTAVAALYSDDPELDPVARLRREAAALRQRRVEGAERRRLQAAARSRRAEGG